MDSDSMVLNNRKIAEHNAAILICLLDNIINRSNQDSIYYHSAVLAETWLNIYENLNKPWTVRKIAALSGFSVSHFNRLCKNMYHISPLQYLKKNPNGKG